jgi:transcriptional regulator with XRE-family HTH domain
MHCRWAACLESRSAFAVFRNILASLNVHFPMTEPHETGEAEDANRREFTPAYCRAARALLDWTQVRLAAKSNLSEATIRDFENGRRILRAERIVAVRKAFESAGVTLTVGGPLLTTSADLPSSGTEDQRAGAPTARNGSTHASKRIRSRPLKGEDAEVKHVVEVHDISPAQARELVRRHGNDWRKIDDAVKVYKDDK